MKVLITDNNDSFTYNLAQLVEQAGCSYPEIIKADQLNLEDVKRFDKILISPGPGLPQDFPNILRLLELYSFSKSILGVCLGHQAIAEFFGAKLFNLNSVYHGVTKKVNILNPDDYLFKNVPVNFDGGLYHSWAVSNDLFPKDLEITSIAEDDIIMSISHRNLDVKGIQFHPESIMTKFGQLIIQNWLDGMYTASY
jgi:anthranilate synthase/aminodeoxychorismate synthase-like glutamine amidotransferase